MKETLSGKVSLIQSKSYAYPHDVCYSVQYRLQQWRQRFLSLASIWMDVLNIQIEKWTIAAVKEDQVS